MITHHLSDQLLMGYSAGTLPEAFSLAVASHIALCDDCRARLASFDAVGEACLRSLVQKTGPRWKAVRLPSPWQGSRPHLHKSAGRSRASVTACFQNPRALCRWRRERNQMALYRQRGETVRVADIARSNCAVTLYSCGNSSAGPRPQRHGIDAGSARRICR